jgi:hypothetical protein
MNCLLSLLLRDNELLLNVTGPEVLVMNVARDVLQVLHVRTAAVTQTHQPR